MVPQADLLSVIHVRIQKGGRGPDPPGKFQNIFGSLAILVRIPLKSQSNQSSIQCWAIIGPPLKRLFKWRFAGGSLMAKKNVVKVGPPLTKLSGSAHGDCNISWSFSFDVAFGSRRDYRASSGCHMFVCNLWL